MRRHAVIRAPRRDGFPLLRRPSADGKTRRLIPHHPSTAAVAGTLCPATASQKPGRLCRQPVHLPQRATVARGGTYPGTLAGALRRPAGRQEATGCVKSVAPAPAPAPAPRQTPPPSLPSGAAFVSRSRFPFRPHLLAPRRQASGAAAPQHYLRCDATGGEIPSSDEVIQIRRCLASPWTPVESGPPGGPVDAFPSIVWSPCTPPTRRSDGRPCLAEAGASAGRYLTCGGTAGGATGGVADSAAAAISRTGQPAMQAVICAAGGGGGARPEEVALSDGRRDTVEVRLNGATGNGVRPGRRGAPYLGGAAPEDRDGRGGGSGHLLAGGRAGHCAPSPATGARLLSAAAGRRTLPQVHVASAAQGAT
ncbi:translation initiation factor IF-2-like [Schistocerca serialis cubense]|uniref:translation initiation factor IF-2-like n=1 Tax=Schistocerca serialis cubense TaxID=2023355 RepID=UPI00214EAEBF|nr:translation initiation factor IF-2-like [Schistocerca serialis cubense]